MEERKKKKARKGERERKKLRKNKQAGIQEARKLEIKPECKQA